MLHAVTFRHHFVGGAFGVGKSSLCRTLSQLLSGERLTASDLIRYAPNPSEATRKATGQVLGNQERLIAALDIRGAAYSTVILDGHFCLPDNTLIVVRLPVNVFERIQLSALVLVEAKVGKIIDRIKQRDGREIHPTLMQGLIQAEREHSHTIVRP